MKKISTLFLTAIIVCSYQFSPAQLCTGIKGPNLLGAKGTFSPPFITINTSASACLTDGSETYNPPGNVGNALDGCSLTIGNTIPCSDYVYTAITNGMQPEFRYSILKNMGDSNGSNCLHTPVWKAKDHTSDGGYFLAVNGAPNDTFSPIFYQVKHIPVCVGVTYEFAAWVISMIPGAGGTDEASPNISFVVNGEVIANSGKIEYNNTGAWVQVGGSFTAETDSVDLQVVNATAIAGGNDLGLDDISIRVCQSAINASGPTISHDGDIVNAKFVVTDPLDQNIWYKIQLSTDGDSTFTNITTGATAIFGEDHTFTVNYLINDGAPVTTDMNGYSYRLVVSTSKSGLQNPNCRYINDYKLIVLPAGILPVQLTSFAGTYSKGIAVLNWQTSQELNTDHFELLRSFDGNKFVSAASIKSGGNSNIVKNYQYKDQVSAAEGNYVFYKLKLVDKDNKFTFSSVIKLSLSDANAVFQLFPNPVLNNFTASFPAPKLGTATLLIRNVNGQKIYSKTIDVIKGNNSVLINNAPLKTGMYYVSIINDDINYTGKLQKQ